MISARERRENSIGQLHLVPVPNYSWKEIGIDLGGPLACTEEGNKYITVVTFHVANFLFDLFLCHGCPDVTISDQGKEFCNQVNLVILPACKIIANH